MLSFFISVFQSHLCQFLALGIHIGPDSVNALKVSHFAGGESARVESTPNITLVHRYVRQRPFSVKLTVTRPRHNNRVMIHEDDLDLPLTVDPDTPEPHIS